MRSSWKVPPARPQAQPRRRCPRPARCAVLGRGHHARHGCDGAETTVCLVHEKRQSSFRPGGARTLPSLLTPEGPLPASAPPLSGARVVTQLGFGSVICEMKAGPEAPASQASGVTILPGPCPAALPGRAQGTLAPRAIHASWPTTLGANRNKMCFRQPCLLLFSTAAPPLVASLSAHLCVPSSMAWAHTLPSPRPGLPPPP